MIKFQANLAGARSATLYAGSLLKQPSFPAYSRLLMPPGFRMHCSPLATYFTPAQRAPTHPSAPKSDCPSVNRCSNYANSHPHCVSMVPDTNTQNRHDHVPGAGCRHRTDIWLIHLFTRQLATGFLSLTGLHVPSQQELAFIFTCSAPYCTQPRPDVNEGADKRWTKSEVTSRRKEFWKSSADEKSPRSCLLSFWEMPWMAPTAMRYWLVPQSAGAV